MIVTGSWHPTTDGLVYTARASLDSKEAVVRLRLGLFGELHLRRYTGDQGMVEVERAAQAVAAIRVCHFSA